MRKNPLSSKERVLAAFAGTEPDRVPIDYLANPGIDRRLKTHYGLRPDDDESLRKALGVDFIEARLPYTGPNLHPDIPDRGVRCDEWGIRRRWIEHGSGGYWDYCDFPLGQASEEEIADWPMPDPDHYDYESLVRTRGSQYAVALGNPGLGDIINTNSMLRTMEETLVDLITDNPAGLLLVRRRMEIQLEVMGRALESKCADFMWMGEDLGTQKGPLISLDLYRKHLRPWHQKFVDLAASFGLPVMMHSCGSSSWVFEDLIEMGVRVVDTLQPEAKDMDPAFLKSRFGDRLAFHGCISTGGSVAFGTVPEVEESCKKVLEIMKPGGGYCFSPTHELQDNSPTENVVAMYETARRCGGY